MNKKIVIVGHGLAGSVLAHTLLQHGLEVVVLDAALPHSATEVSAGLINPFIGPKLNVPDEFSTCMEENQKFFKKMENESGEKFLESIDLHRIFQSAEQGKKWNLSADAFRKGNLSVAESLNMGIASRFGAGITKAWQLKPLRFIEFSRKLLSSRGNYFVELFDPEKWRDYRVIFCDGYRASRNQWFKHLPFSPAQGEVLKIQSPYNFNASNGIWHLAEKKGSAQIGSTWNHQDIEAGPTDQAVEEILGKIDFLPKLNGDGIIGHKSGVRSATIDRNPILGSHPEIKNYFIFNGFGSRGCTTIALCAKELKDFLIQGDKIPAHKDLLRFHK